MNPAKRIAAMLALLAPLTGWAQAAPAGPAGNWLRACADGASLRFRTQFEGDNAVRPDAAGRFADLSGKDNAEDCDPRARARAPGLLRLGRAQLQFDGGDDAERDATIVDAPGAQGNHALRFRIQSPNVRGRSGNAVKGRVQLNVYGNRGVKTLRESVRLYLGDDLAALNRYPGTIDWLTISEWWNNAPWGGEKFPFRITVNIVKPDPAVGAPLRFGVHAQPLDKAPDEWAAPIWQQVDGRFEVPTGRWMTLEYLFVEGKGNAGRFQLAVTPDGGRRQVVFDVHDSTAHPDDPAPDGLNHFNPIKLYTSVKTIDFVKKQGGQFQVFWDDLSLRACDPQDPCN